MTMTDIDNRPQTYDHLKSKKKPMRREVIIPFDDAPVEAYERAKAALDRAVGEKRPPKVLAPIQEQYDEALAALKEESSVLVFQSLGHKKFQKLINENPATDEQMAKWEEDNLIPSIEGDPTSSKMPKRGAEPKPDYDPERFPCILISACCISPVLSIENVEEMRDDWNDEEMLELWVAALEVNTSRRAVNWGKG